MYLTQAFSVIYYGQIPIKMYRAGEKMIEESVSHLAKK